MIGRRTLALALASLLAACASPVTVQTDFDAKADFGAYRSYSWIADPSGESSLMPQSVVQGIDARLQARGWKRVADGEVHVAAHLTTRDGQTYNTFYSGIGHDLTWLGFGPVPDRVVMSTNPYRKGTLVIDMFDGRSRRAIWRGSAEGVLPDDPLRIDASVRGALDRLFADFPPGTTAPRRSNY
ncbi:DUF4136 domain-containing protein [Variovorax sp. J22P168]|uniref:DUF4136 domain-containing protein n=1 Tax=Variovorax jilinensis TaxID=3053513 RepID=UPI0025786AC1|nr:DUF4136 domain-containing protein [Variovorax sp. J22P168]MDM0014301.1 DUF4136 domain-containing protein [Variovorax sp. J22P168]